MNAKDAKKDGTRKARSENKNRMPDLHATLYTVHCFLFAVSLIFLCVLGVLCGEAFFFIGE